eukprot:1370161-Amorphochlora_amoeboformis.AAC.2
MASTSFHDRLYKSGHESGLLCHRISLTALILRNQEQPFVLDFIIKPLGLLLLVFRLFLGVFALFHTELTTARRADCLRSGDVCGVSRRSHGNFW